MKCPCGTQDDFAACCGPILEGKSQARTAEQLMRARYSAYVRGAIDFLRDSLHAADRGAFDRNGAEQWSRQAQWRELEVLKTVRGGEDDDEGMVEFVARYKMGEQDVEHHELATFRREDGMWRFVDGKTPSAEPYRRPTPKIGANEPCPCGSGKKYKKCCGKVA